MPPKYQNLCLCFLLCLSLPAQARKFNVKFGAFDITAKTSEQSGNLSNLGAYALSFQQELGDQLEASFGYSVMMSEVVGGDLAFGLDIGLNYFPFSFLRGKKTATSQFTLSQKELWRPYIGVNFSERRFQSVESNYAGFGLSIGTERQLNYQNYALLIEFRYTSFNGTQTATATEMNFFTGLSIPF